MRPIFPLLRVSQNSVRTQSIFLRVKAVRYSSIDSLQSSLHQELTSRPKNRIFDYLSPTPSHLLNITLSDFLPESCQPPYFTKQNLELPDTWPKRIPPQKAHHLPQGHHLVYFPPQVPSSSLLPDGTDHLQSPGSPFDHRMWAGGSLHFDAATVGQLRLKGTRICCTESMSNVVVRGSYGNEKVFVTIKREVGRVLSKEVVQRLGLLEQVRQVGHNFIMPPSIVEERNLVYFRQKSKAAIEEGSKRPGKILKPAQEPDFFVNLTPTPALLFRFSALTFNAHSIHLDPQYCREVEGHRNLLVHGPLSLVLMLSVLRSQLKEKEIVLNFEYRNLAPLYVDEELRVCVKKDSVKDDKYDIWIEGKEGGYAVKGNAVIGRIKAVSEHTSERAENS